MKMRLLGAFLAPVFALLSTSAIAEAGADEDEARWGADEFADDLIHSRLPLYGFDWDEFWPQPVSDEDSFGCASINIGDWRFEPNSADERARPYSMRFELRGIFTCGIRVFEEDEQGLRDEGGRLGFFARIGEGEISGELVQIWVLQLGARPGSEYLLLAQLPGETGGEEYSVLQRRCPFDRLLRVRNLDSYRTDYCAIDSHEELLALASDMLEFPPLGTLTKQEGPDAFAPDPSNSQPSN
ncbi:MAG: hypothetical protein AAF697_06785 [Pseudomonadota bacterium]